MPAQKRSSSAGKSKSQSDLAESAKAPAVAAQPPVKKEEKAIVKPVESDDLGPVRDVSPATIRAFGAWTAFWWGLVVLWGGLFFTAQIDFPTSTKYSLYGVSVWLNGWLIALWSGRSRSTLDRYHELVALWLTSYGITNAAWELPYILLSRNMTKLTTLDEVVAHTGWMRESIFNMWYWVLASFSSCDLRTVNHDGTFYALEMFCITNLTATALFFWMNKKRNPDRYLVPLYALGGAPFAATIIFSFAEVFNGYPNMQNSVADTLLALVWTQYQYMVFPLITAALCIPLLRADWVRK